MRHRKVKNEEEKLAEQHRYLIEDPKARKGGWHEVFGNGNEIFAEFGCGKGKFIMTLAEQNPGRNYVAFEGRGSIILRALEKAAQKGPENIVFVKEYIKDVNEYFGEGELSGIYLNFSDPWPKDRHARRRLTHSRYLDGYRNVLKKGCCIEFKTDNSGMFAFALGEFESSGMKLLESTEDLYGTALAAKNVTTEYEDKFLAEGRKINYCKVQV
ncbi:MAG TPA: tRNA (guanosine(46)-N7)-methyltransferase TrmB [Anaerovoracaceae bacterium]|nr:tRNA (guanosine(46)-N7)-methyltransferase TrmB [Anaerovoracaceae bacterium]